MADSVNEPCQQNITDSEKVKSKEQIFEVRGDTDLKATPVKSEDTTSSSVTKPNKPKRHNKKK